MSWCDSNKHALPFPPICNPLVVTQYKGNRHADTCHRLRSRVMYPCIDRHVAPLQVRLRGAILTSFLPLEAALDDAVGEVVALDIERAGKPMTLEVAVQAGNS
jgi:hypothetical protein